jgi:hypothetical protein
MPLIVDCASIRYLASELPVYPQGIGPVLLAAIGVLPLVGFVTSFLLPRRATRVDPAVALRSE